MPPCRKILVLLVHPLLMNWIRPFWILIALKAAAERPKIYVEKIRNLSNIYKDEIKWLEDKVIEIINNKSKYEWIVGKADLEKGKNFLLEILSAILDRQEKQKYARLIETNISKDNIDKIKVSCHKGFIENREIANFARYYKMPEKVDSPLNDSEIKIRNILLDKECLVDISGHSGLFESCGQHIGSEENVCCAYKIETNMPDNGFIANFDEMADTIKQEAEELRKKGYKPNVVFIPKDNRYGKALTDEPEWERESPINIGPFFRWVTKLDGLDVFEWPHENAKSVAIIDVVNFIAFEQAERYKGSPLKIELRKMDPKEIEKLEQKTSDNKEQKQILKYCDDSIEKMAETKRILELMADVQVGYVDPEAGIKLLPTVETMGYIYRNGEDVYHRIDCAKAQEIQNEERKYFENIYIARFSRGFKQCDECNPNYDMSE